MCILDVLSTVLNDELWLQTSPKSSIWAVHDGFACNVKYRLILKEFQLFFNGNLPTKLSGSHLISTVFKCIFTLWLLLSDTCFTAFIKMAGRNNCWARV